MMLPNSTITTTLSKQSVFRGKIFPRHFLTWSIYCHFPDTCQVPWHSMFYIQVVTLHYLGRTYVQFFCAIQILLLTHSLTQHSTSCSTSSLHLMLFLAAITDTNYGQLTRHLKAHLFRAGTLWRLCHTNTPTYLQLTNAGLRNQPLKVRVHVTEASLSSEVNQDSRRGLASITTTEATVANAAARWTQPLLHQ